VAAEHVKKANENKGLNNPYDLEYEWGNTYFYRIVSVFECLKDWRESRLAK
jgi:hypothetical protein